MMKSVTLLLVAQLWPTKGAAALLQEKPASFFSTSWQELAGSDMVAECWVWTHRLLLNGVEGSLWAENGSPDSSPSCLPELWPQLWNSPHS